MAERQVKHDIQFMTHASVFSGIGGPEVAATMLGWENLFHCEINPFGRQVLDYWYPNSKSYEDITTTDFREWRGRVDVLTGGFPCQPFSYAGRRRGAEDDRYLWPSMYRAIDEIQPTWVVAENVAGILTMVEQGEVSKVAGTASLFDAFDDLRGRYELRETFTLQRICTDLESHGYAVQPVLVPACAVGAPHRRDRVFIVARRNDAPYPNGTRARDNDGATCDEGRKAREDWREGIRQGHGQTGASGTEPTSANDATIPQDSMHSRQLHGQDEVEGSERNIGNVGAGGSERICGETSRTTSADTDCNGHSAQAESGRPETSRRSDNGESCQRSEPTEWSERFYSLLRNHADTDREGLERAAGLRVQGHEGRGERDGIRERPWNSGESIPIGRWDAFPSVSPVHRGNDGLPFDVDRLTLSFGKWRTEALKAYGNAIVPQVMYEIFRAIEIVEQREQR